MGTERNVTDEILKAKQEAQIIQKDLSKDVSPPGIEPQTEVIQKDLSKKSSSPRFEPQANWAYRASAEEKKMPDFNKLPYSLRSQGDN